MNRTPLSTVFALALLAGLVRHAGATDPPRDAGPRAGVVFAGSGGDFDQAFTFSGALGYRLNRHLGIELELSYVPNAKLDDGGGFSDLRLPGWRDAGFSATGNDRVLLFTTNLRAEIPTEVSWLTPYVVAGGGLANVRREAELRLEGLPNLLRLEELLRGLELLPGLPAFVEGLLGARGGRFDDTFSLGPSSSTDLALTVGVGFSFMPTERLSIDADFRYFWIGAWSDSLNVFRYGVGASYRF